MASQLAVALLQGRSAMPHDLDEMEGQRQELGGWMTLTVMTSAATGDCNQGMMASEFGWRPMLLLLLLWTRNGGGGGGGTRHGWNDDDRRIDDQSFDDDGGGETKPAVIIDGKTYRFVKLRQGAVVPQRQLPLLLSSYHLLERAYWLRSELRGAIYGRI